MKERKAIDDLLADTGIELDKVVVSIGLLSSEADATMESRNTLTLGELMQKQEALLEKMDECDSSAEDNLLEVTSQVADGKVQTALKSVKILLTEFVYEAAVEAAKPLIAELNQEK